MSGPLVHSLASGQQNQEATTSSLSVLTWTLLCGWAKFPCTPIARIWCQSLLLAAFLMYPEFAVSAVDAVVAYYCTTDSAWVFTWTLQEPHTTDHNLCLSGIYPQSLLLHGFFPYQESPDTFLQRVSNDDLHIGPPRELQSGTHLTRLPA